MQTVISESGVLTSAGVALGVCERKNEMGGGKECEAECEMRVIESSA